MNLVCEWPLMHGPLEFTKHKIVVVSPYNQANMCHSCVVYYR